MRCLMALTVGLWSATVTWAGEQVPAFSAAFPTPAPSPAAFAPGCEATPDAAAETWLSCGPCRDSAGRFWGSVEFLYWHASGYDAPPLLTTSPPGVPQSAAGVLGVPGTTVLAGGELNDDAYPGLRFEGGLWLDECRTWGIGGSYFLLFDDTEVTQASSPGTPPLARPFFNAALDRPDAEIIAFPGVAGGTGAVATSFALQGADANVRCNLYCTPDTPCDCARSGCWRLDALVGYRYLRLHEDLVVMEDLTTGPASAVAAGTRFVVRDGFRTENRFHGGQIGLAGQVRSGRLSLDATARLGIGATHQVVTVNGTTTTTSPGQAPATQPGGLLALPSNSGRFVADEFTLVPELGIRVGYRLTGGLRVFVGYDLLYWDNVARPGEQIDLVINPTQIPPGGLVGVARPAPTGRDTDLFLHGLSTGIEFRW